jgi:acylphosphatase
MKKQVAIKIFGEVQRVGFRYFVYKKAMELGLVGWAQNEADGAVGILAEGEENDLKKLIEYCQAGPEFAKVDRVEVKWKEASGGLEEFMIR